MDHDLHYGWHSVQARLVAAVLVANWKSQIKAALAGTADPVKDEAKRLAEEYQRVKQIDPDEAERSPASDG